MALPILDGNQSATTLSTILSSGQHITAHTVVSLGTQAITDITSAVSGTSVCVGSISISGTPSVTGSVSVLNFPASQAVTFSAVSISNFPSTQPVSIASVTVGNTVTIAGTVTANPTGTQTIAGTVTANGIAFNAGEATPDKAVWIAHNLNNTLEGVSDSAPLPISGTVTIGSALPTGTNRIGVVTIGAGTVTLGAGTQKIGSVTAFGRRTNYTDGIEIPIVQQGDAAGGYGYNDNPFIPIRIITNQTGGASDFVGDNTGGNLPISGTVTVGNSVTIGSLPAISGTVTANTFALQGTAVTTSNFTSTTASTVLANFNATREVLTIFNEGAGNLHICAGATCTTIAYQVRLSAGDYYEVPNHQTTITHSAVFATAGTARIVQIS